MHKQKRKLSQYGKLFMIVMTHLNSEIHLIGEVYFVLLSGMGLLDYLKYVPKPMDLNTISRQLR